MSSRITVTTVPFDRSVEVLVDFTRAADDSVVADWRSAPGALVRSPYAKLGLHYAPARWLLLDPDSDHVNAAVEQGAIATDTTGNWSVYSLSGANVRGVLSAGCNIDRILKERHCAALTLFDCPVIIARNGSDFVVCVQSSYDDSLRLALGEVRIRVP